LITTGFWTRQKASRTETVQSKGLIALLRQEIDNARQGLCCPGAYAVFFALLSVYEMVRFDTRLVTT
jgi:hypothetical protein